MVTTNQSQEAPGLPRGLNVMLTLAAGIVLVAGLKAFADIVGPVFMAFVVVMAVSPIQGALTRRGAPGWLAGVAMFLCSFGVVAAIVAALVWSAAELTQLITGDTYADQLQNARADIADLLEEVGVSGDELEGVLDSVDLGTVAGEVASALSGVFGLLSAFGLLVTTMLFVVMDSAKFERSLGRLTGQRPTVVEALQNFAGSTRSYFVVSSVFGVIVAALDVVALWALGIPLALVWGVLSFITNYIPNIGFVIGLIPPALLAFFEGGWSLALWVIVIYSAINFVIQSVLQPKFVGDAVGLSTTLTFLSLIFWGWVIGPLGALLAVPLTLLAKALLIDIDPTTQWIAPLISLDDGSESTSSGSGLRPGKSDDP
jgi:predicted PurR-regulated permease PerM